MSSYKITCQAWQSSPCISRERVQALLTIVSLEPHIYQLAEGFMLASIDLSPSGINQASVQRRTLPSSAELQKLLLMLHHSRAGLGQPAKPNGPGQLKEWDGQQVAACLSDILLRCICNIREQPEDKDETTASIGKSCSFQH